MEPFGVIFLAYFVIILFIKVKVFRIQGDEGGALKDNWTFPVVFVSYLVVVMASLAEYYIGPPRIILPVSIMGYLLGTAGVMVTRGSVLALGRWWSIRIEIKKDHQVVEEGPYRISRHPYYLGTLLELGGLCFILNSFRTLLYLLFVHVPILLARISSEEKALSLVLGTPYTDYKKRVRIVPIPFPRFMKGTQGRSCIP